MFYFAPPIVKPPQETQFGVLWKCMAGKIVIVSSPKTWGGGEELAWTLGNGLIAKGHEVVWVTRRESFLHERQASKNQECLLIQGKYPSLTEMVSLRQTLCDRKITTIYGNDSRAIAWSGLLGFGMRGVSKISVKHTVFPIKFLYCQIGSLIECKGVEIVIQAASGG